MVIRVPKWLLLCISALFLSQGNKVVDNLFEYSKNIEIFTALYKELGATYVDEIEPGQLMKTGIDAMLKSLDPYTNFFSEYQAEEALMERQGQYGGVGCRITQRNHYPTVEHIEEGYAFDIADVRLGDQITHINGLNLKDKSTEELLTLVRGAPNTKFQITLSRNGKSMDKTITRMAIKTASVSYSGLYQGNIAYVKLEEFDQNACDEIETSLKKMMEKTTLQGVILDLRDNGGGLLAEAVKIVGLFVGENKSVVTLKGQNVTGPKNWFTPNKALLPNTPLLVLINERSASASEVVSGSLQDMDRAVVMGQTSFGKGLVQNYVSLPYRTQMKLTTAKYYTPSGRCIQRLNYQERGSDGQATVMAQEKKRAFLTQNGRKVYEGGGIDPDKFLDPYQGLSIYKWLEKEHILFDWANDQYNAQPDTLFAAVNDALYTQFVNYAIQKSQVSLQAKWQKAVANTYADTNFIKKTGGFQINQSQLQNALKTELQANKAAIVQVLNRELMERKFKKIQFFKSWLEYDPETKEAAALLLNTTAYQKILNP
ncbi:MAG: S41 family peptidase [Bacteroidia bacterium]|nr:S41 family peptidase [Bacteroidia bacterium]